VKEYTYLGTIPTNENKWKPWTEKRITNANRESFALLAESWTLNKDIAKMAGLFERKILRRISGGIKVKKNWGKWYNKELLQLFGDLDILSF
jgi:hypothetical protein